MANNFGVLCQTYQAGSCFEALQEGRSCGTLQFHLHFLPSKHRHLNHVCGKVLGKILLGWREVKNFCTQLKNFYFPFSSSTLSRPSNSFTAIGYQNVKCAFEHFLFPSIIWPLAFYLFAQGNFNKAFLRFGYYKKEISISKQDWNKRMCGYVSKFFPWTGQQIALLNFQTTKWGFGSL